MTGREIIFGALLSAVFIFLLGQASSASAAEWCYDFKADLKVGSRGYEVGALQAALQKEGLLVGRLDAIFGQRTKYALIAFQEKYKEEVLIPLWLKNGTGFVGKGTRAKLNKLYGCQILTSTPTSTPTPTIPVAPAVPATLNVISPNGGEKLNQGADLSIKWTSSGLDKISIIIINYVTGDQTEIVNSVLAASGQYLWQIPSGFASGGKYKITVKAGKTIDLSDNYFNIAAVKKPLAPSLTLLSPLGGEQWEKGKIYSIKWLYQDIDKIDSIILTDYSRNITYSLATNIGASLNNNSFSWEIPSVSSVIPVSSSYKIKIESCSGSACYSDQSDNYFSIVSYQGAKFFKNQLADITALFSRLKEKIKELLIK